ncbi:hypothetical protein GCM10027202_32300 [Microvirgula curvata]
MSTFKNDIEYMLSLAHKDNIDAIKSLFFTIISSPNEFSLDEMAKIYYTTYRIWFSLSQENSFDDQKILMYKAYETLFIRSERLACSDAPPPCRAAEKNTADIVVLTGQFLDSQHAPTIAALTHCIYLKKLGFNPIIINCDTYCIPYPFFSGLFYATNIPQFSNAGIDIQLHTGMGFTLQENGSQTSQVIFEENQFEFYQLSGSLEDKISNFNGIFQDIIAQNVDIISVGDANIFADLLARTNKCIVYHTSVETPVASVRAPAIFPKKLNNNEHALLEKLGVTDNVIEVEIPLFHHMKNANRSNNLDMQEDEIVFAIVGRRLSREVNKNFILLMRNIKNAISNARFVFAGEALDENILKYADEHALLDCMTQIGFVPDTAEMYRSAHFYVNPSRRGGGSSAFEALYQGVPVITYCYGDVHSIVGSDFSFESDEDILAYLDSCINDQGFYLQQKKLAKKIAAEKDGSNDAYRKFLTEIGIPSLA